MDWPAYKARCDSPEFWSRWLIERWLELLAEASAVATVDGTADQRAATSNALERALCGARLPKPADHRGGPATDMFEVMLSVEQAQGLLVLLDSLPAPVVATPAQRARGLGGFREAMVEYLTWRIQQ